MPSDFADAMGFYARTLEALNRADMPFLVGGGAALAHYTAVARDTKDLDIFVRRTQYEAVMEVLASAGCHIELTFPHWLGKATCQYGYVDVIFNSGNGIAAVDDGWFQHSTPGTAFGLPVRLCPVEETIWSKAFIMERERYDAADVMHLILARAEKMDWVRLVTRFGPHWRVLFSHLCLFGFIYPSERDRIPEWVMKDFITRLQQEMRTAAPAEKTCQGTLLSREQYLIDVQRWGLEDARNSNASSMTPRDVALWTDAIDNTKKC